MSFIKTLCKLFQKTFEIYFHVFYRNLHIKYWFSINYLIYIICGELETKHDKFNSV